LKVLITGGAGYIGSMLAPMLLSNGHEVRVLDNLLHTGRSILGVWAHPLFEFRHADVRDKEIVRDALEGVDAVVHLAAIVGDPACARNPELARSVNLEASLHLLDESRKRGVSRFVFASTCSNYGKMADPTQSLDETSELRPVSLYAETKVSVERAILDAPQVDGFIATALRFATVFGVSSRMRFDLTVNEFTMEMLTKKHLVVFGEQFWRPYIHVRDVARAVLQVLQSPPEKVKGQVFNVGSNEQNYQKQQLVEMIQPYAPEAVVEYVRKEEDPRDYRVAFDKIRNELGFCCERSVDDGIREVVGLVQNGIIQDFEQPEYRN
jgi:nucleoside-diphosphate-sugar epimerase